MENIYDNQYEYFFYGLSEYEVQDIQTIFNEGLTVNYSMFGFLKFLKVNEKDILEEKGIDNLYRTRTRLTYNDYGLIIKIPCNYLHPHMNKEVKICNLMPLIKKVKKTNRIMSEQLLIPYVIEGAYRVKDNLFIENPNYNLLYNPNGLLFTPEQLEELSDDSFVNKLNLFRSSYTYDELCELDEQNHVWDETIAFYNIIQSNKNKIIK